MRVLLTLSVVAMLAAGCGRTPLNGTPGLLTDGGGPQDAAIPDGAKHDGPRPDGALPDGPLPFDGPRPDGPWWDGARPDGARPDGARPDGARPDAPPPFDAAPSDGSTPGLIDCGNTTCNAATQECCVTWQGNASCIARGAQCQGAVATCDGPEDCNPGQICCGRNGGGNRGLNCAAPNACNNGARVCHLGADCAAGDRCCLEADIAGYTVLTCAPAADCPNIGPGVACGGATCYSPQVCCVSYSGSTSCTSAGGCSGGLPVRCDGPEDCGGGTPVCCGEVSTGTSCVVAGSCASGYTGGVVCHTTTDCPAGQTCTDVPYAGLRVCF